MRTNGSTELEDFPLTFVVAGQVFETTWLAVPLSNRVAALKKVVKHKLSNESYSSAISIPEVKKTAGLTDDMSSDDRKEALRVYREANPDDWSAALLGEATKNWNLVLEEGGISETDRSRGDSVESEYFRLLDRAIAAEFKGKKGQDGKALKVPTNDTDFITFADGETWTRQELRDFIASTRREELWEQAEKNVAGRKVEAKSKPTEAPVTSAADMGFSKVQRTAA
jgi:hypothetical protein